MNTLTFSQTTKFEWQDSTFEIGQKREIQLLFDFDGPCTIRPCYKFEENRKTIDSLILFLGRNPNIEIEIGYHQTQIGDKEYHQRISEIYAEGIKKELVARGISKDRIKSNGYVESMSIISQEKIEINAKKEKYLKINSRIEVEIIKV